MGVASPGERLQEPGCGLPAADHAKNGHTAKLDGEHGDQEDSTVVWVYLESEMLTVIPPSWFPALSHRTAVRRASAASRSCEDAGTPGIGPPSLRFEGFALAQSGHHENRTPLPAIGLMLLALPDRTGYILIVSSIAWLHIDGFSKCARTANTSSTGLSIATVVWTVPCS